MPPRIWPRDATDCLLSVSVGSLLTLFLALPAIVLFVITRSHAVAIAAFLIAYALFFLFSVRRLSITADGIRFHRTLGTPRFLPWSSICSIAVVPRAEVVVHGWLWPPFPPREATASLTTSEHYRISWDGGFCYYPPADPDRFERHVLAHLQPRTI